MKIILAVAMLFVATQSAEAEMVTATGVFHGGNHAPGDTAKGGVTLVKLDSGSYELRLGDDFSTTPGPDLFVYLSVSPDPKNDSAIAKNTFFNVGKLASPQGLQQFALPKDFKPTKFRSVAIWCKSYGVLFGAAALAAQ
jgi:Electron transfer DM13